MKFLELKEKHRERLGILEQKSASVAYSLPSAQEIILLYEEAEK
jgi:hypothetical protein